MANEETNQKDQTDDVVKSLREALQKKPYCTGTRETIKNLKKGKVTHVYCASNTAREVFEDITYYASFDDVPVTKIEQDNLELAVISKRKHIISVLSFLKE